jgi:hypothetical protein
MCTRWELDQQMKCLPCLVSFIYTSLWHISCFVSISLLLSWCLLVKHGSWMLLCLRLCSTPNIDVIGCAWCISMSCCATKAGRKRSTVSLFLKLSIFNTSTYIHQSKTIEVRMDKNKDSGVSGGVKFVTSTLGNVTGGLARTVGEY